MDLPYMIDSDDADSLNMSTVSTTSTTKIHEEEINPPIVTTITEELNPDDLNLYIYEVPETKPAPKQLKRSQAVTIEELEDELIQHVCDSNATFFNTLYLLHEHFSKSKTTTKNEKNVMKGRIINKLSLKISQERLNEFTTLLNNFMN